MQIAPKTSFYTNNASKSLTAGASPQTPLDPQRSIDCLSGAAVIFAKPQLPDGIDFKCIRNFLFEPKRHHYHNWPLILGLIPFFMTLYTYLQIE